LLTSTEAILCWQAERATEDFIFFLLVSGGGLQDHPRQDVVSSLRLHQLPKYQKLSSIAPKIR
jgi:hypothetical protein